VLFVFIFTSCVPKSYDFIGTWNRQPDNLTYINHDKHIKLTFPNTRWKIYTSPNELPDYQLRKDWLKPTEENPNYRILLAMIPDIGMIMQLNIQDMESEVTLEEFVAIQKVGFDMNPDKLSDLSEYNSEVIERHSKKIGVLQIKMTSLKILSVIFQEERRFTILMFLCPEGLFESKKDQFWSIIDSYEYIE
jgi:hypothetical protein